MSDPNIIYHYCSLSTFLNIIKNKTLRLSNIVKSNDYLERSYIVSCCEDAIINYFQTCSCCSAQELKDLVHKHLSAAIEKYNKECIIGHAICFSQEGDLLSQWREYGDKGNGMAIGFDRSVLERFFNRGTHLRLDNVIYSETVDADLKILVKNFCTKVQEVLEGFPNGDSLSGNISVACREIVIRLFLDKALVYKNPGFREEQEVRLHTCIPLEEYGSLTYKKQKVSSAQSSDSQQGNSPFFTKLKEEIVPLSLEYNFIAKSNTIVSYFDIGFDPQIANDSNQSEYLPNQFIKKIVIGPKADISIEEMKHILWAHNLGGCMNSIQKSKTSYR